MEKLETVLLVLLYWMSGQGEQVEAKSAFRWAGTVAECQVMLADLDKGLKEKYGPDMMSKGVCLTENQVDIGDPRLQNNKKLIP